jgi:hypothetical protein
MNLRALGAIAAALLFGILIFETLLPDTLARFGSMESHRLKAVFSWMSVAAQPHEGDFEDLGQRILLPIEYYKNSDSRSLNGIRRLRLSLLTSKM